LPKLLLFAPCERVIVDKQDNSTSLISLIEGLSVVMPNTEKIPPDAGSPMQWHIVTLWLREPGDETKRYEQTCELVMPDGKISVPARTSFRLERRAHRITVRIRGFPISRTPGDCVLRLSLREDVEGSEWREIATYPINVKHLPRTT
jgi:hypothetical protein